MSTSTRRVVLTGLGVITPLGNDPASFWDSLRQGRSGVRTIQSFEHRVLEYQLAPQTAGAADRVARRDKP